MSSIFDSLLSSRNTVHRARDSEGSASSVPLTAPGQPGDLGTGAARKLFDADWYLTTYKDVAAAGVDPFSHYFEHGFGEGRSPHALFDTSWYLAQNPDVAAAGINPLLHYLDHGANEGRDPHPLFDSSWYLDRNPDVVAAGVNPLAHYLEHGSRAQDPHPLFDTSWYLARNPDVVATGINPLVHYVTVGAAEGRDPHPLFNVTWYRTIYQEALADADRDPLSHYLSSEGLRLQTNPNRYFDRNWYLHTYPDVVGTGFDALAHYALIGAGEGRDPSPLFQTRFYGSAYPDVIQAGISPLVHFLTNGEAEGREPRDLHGRTAPLPAESNSYTDWLSRRQMTKAHASLQRRMAENFTQKPLISLIVPIYKVKASVFKQLLSSVMAQTYERWELCLAVSYFDDTDLLAVIDRAEEEDSRIKVRRLETNRGISHNSNDALTLATGTFIALLDHDDALPPDALYEIARAIESEDGDFFYSDKDAVNEDGSQHFHPLFKPAWSPEIMLSANYLTHLNVIRRSFITRIGGWDPETDGAQDWDLFLRVAAAGARIRHIPKVLYNWRHVETSVAARGLDAKPYAAQGQLTAVQRWLRSQGWTEAEAAFTPEGYIRVRWSEAWRPRIGLVLFGAGGSEAAWRTRIDAGRLGPHTDIRHGGPTLATLSETVASLDAEIVVVVPAALSPMSADWLTELVAPLENPDITAVCGKVLDPAGQILDAGWVFSDREWRPLFRGADPFSYGIFGSAHWFRNFGAASLNGIAFRTAQFVEAGGLHPAARPDLALTGQMRAGEAGPSSRRIVYNPFATAVLPPEHSFEQWWLRNAAARGDALPPAPKPAGDQDPYFNVNLFVGENGIPKLRGLPLPARSQSHNYEAEAAYFGQVLDFGADSDTGDIVLPSGQGQRRIAWIVPDFSMPFYGGIMTILRCAEYFRQKGIAPVIIGHGSPDAETLRSAIALAFPDLAAALEVHTLRADEDVNSKGIAPLDGAFCTLWTTAFILRNMRNVRKKFYFVQDYEPLFYPAGTTSSLVEATYQFNFFGVCNTEPLKHLYEVFGGKAEFFTPAVDRDVFHIRGRTEKGRDAPVTIFNYARPGHPRNCFELLAPALAEVKRRHKDGVQIFTAGADWRPEDHGLSGAVEHLGLMPYAATGDLYRSCDIGVVAMATCHPSYLPFELMASGAVVCTNVNRHTTWLLRHLENACLFEMSKTSIANALTSLITDAPLRRRLSEGGLKTIQQGYGDWDASCARVYEIVTSQLRG
jgi:glycosyltransferase involved in cell wall biosynthesis